MKPRPLLCILPLLVCPLLAAQQDGKPKPGRKPQKPRLQVMALPTYPVVQRGAASISVDGSLHEWPRDSVPGLVLMHPAQISGSANKSFRGPTDLSANGGLLWDEEHLYLWLAIKDDWGRPLHTGRAAPTRLLLPPGDSVVLFFDPRRDTRSYGPDPGRGEDREYWIGMTHRGGTLCVAWQRRYAIAKRETDVEARMLYDREKRQYTVEARIPWSEILAGKKPEKGLAIDFQLVINDFDEPTDPLPQTRIGWTFGTGLKVNPAIYGTLLLAGARWMKRGAPERPPLPETEKTLPDSKFWIELQRSLSALPAYPGKRGLSGKRRALLDSLDGHLASYPLVDHQQMLILMQREMVRELAGYAAEGPPYYFTLVMQQLVRDLGVAHKGAPRVIALPGRGFLVRSESGNVAIAPSCLHGQVLGKHVDAVCYANAPDPLDRHDPLMLRTLARKKPVLAHVSFHLPGWGPLRKENLVNPGFEITVGKDIRVRVLGKKDETGRVTPTVGFQLTWPNGFTVVHASLSALPEQVKLPEGKEGVDVLILDYDHQAAKRFVEQLKPKTVVLEGFLDMNRWAPGSLPRTHRIGEVEAALEALEREGTAVVLLAPGQGTSD